MAVRRDLSHDPQGERAVPGLFFTRQGNVVQADQGNAFVFPAHLPLREHAGDDGYLNADFFGQGEGGLNGSAGGNHVIQEAQFLPLKMAVLFPAIQSSCCPWVVMEVTVTPLGSIIKLLRLLRNSR